MVGGRWNLFLSFSLSWPGWSLPYTRVVQGVAGDLLCTDLLCRIRNFLFRTRSLPSCSILLLSNCDLSGLFSFFKPVSISSKEQYKWETYLPYTRYRLPSNYDLFGVTLEQYHLVELSARMGMFHTCTNLVATSHVWLLSREILLCATEELNLKLCFISVHCNSNSPMLLVATMWGHHSTRAFK